MLKSNKQSYHFGKRIAIIKQHSRFDIIYIWTGSFVRPLNCYITLAYVALWQKCLETPGLDECRPLYNTTAYIYTASRVKYFSCQSKQRVRTASCLVTQCSVALPSNYLAKRCVVTKTKYVLWRKQSVCCFVAEPGARHHAALPASASQWGRPRLPSMPNAQASTGKVNGFERSIICSEVVCSEKKKL